MSLSQKIVTLSNRLTRKSRQALTHHYPTADFGQEHVRHLVSFRDRETLLDHLLKGGVVAEIGVNEGEFSEKILSVCQPKKLVLIDVWASKRYHGGLFEKVKNRFAK